MLRLRIALLAWMVPCIAAARYAVDTTRIALIGHSMG